MVLVSQQEWSHCHGRTVKKNTSIIKQCIRYTLNAYLCMDKEVQLPRHWLTSTQSVTYHIIYQSHWPSGNVHSTSTYCGQTRVGLAPIWWIKSKYLLVSFDNLEPGVLGLKHFFGYLTVFFGQRLKQARALKAIYMVISCQQFHDLILMSPHSFCCTWRVLECLLKKSKSSAVIKGHMGVQYSFHGTVAVKLPEGATT